MNQLMETRSDSILLNAEKVQITNSDRIVVLSDLHMGDGGKRDDFRLNSEFFSDVLKDYYKKDFGLILNGDIEELQKFSFQQIRNAWKNVYSLFDNFAKENRLIKTIGNHDERIHTMPKYLKKYRHCEGIILDYEGEKIFVLHGHQFSEQFNKYNDHIGWILKYLAAPLGIMNYSVAHNSRKKFKVETLGYKFSVENKILTIIGHTHRPLFESMSKADTLKYKIEHILRYIHEYPESEQEEQVEKLQIYRDELAAISAEGAHLHPHDQLYSPEVVLPCLFNSGCVIGKSGFTALEIQNGEIALVYWFDKNKTEKYFSFNGYRPIQMGESSYFRTVLKKEPLNYIFNKIRLLS
jgi:UDP-2,3-diacylglucosamine pyrophosphatase LpxH